MSGFMMLLIFSFSNEVRDKRASQNQDQPIIPGRNRPKPVDSYNPSSNKRHHQQQQQQQQLIDSEISEMSPKHKSRSRRLQINNSNNINNNNNSKNGLPQNSIGSPQSNLTSKMDDSDSVITAIQKRQIHEHSGTQVKHYG